MAHGRKTIFLTGASGVVGQALLKRLSGHTVVCLVHKTPIEAPNVVSLSGDITRPQFGWSDSQFNDLAHRIDGVIHSAAVTKFVGADGAIFQTNVEGTRNVLELSARRQVPFYHVSTAFVHDCKYAFQAEPTTYERSKREAEQVVRESGLLTTILRPSIIVGDSNTGEISSFQGFHLIASLVLTGALPMIPTPPDSYIDFIPQDVVADVIAAMVEQDLVGGEYFITSGDRTLSLGTMVNIAADNALRITGREIPRPRLVDPDVFDRLIKPVFLPALPREMQRIVKRALQVARYISLQEPLPSSLPQLRQKLPLAPCPDLAEALVRNLEYWAQATDQQVLALTP